MYGRCHRDTRRLTLRPGGAGYAVGGGARRQPGSRSCRRGARGRSGLPVTGRWRLVVTSPTSSRVTRAAHRRWGSGRPPSSVSHGGPGGASTGGHYARTCERRERSGTVRSEPGTGSLYRWIVSPDCVRWSFPPSGSFLPSANVDHLTHKSGQSAVGERLAAGLAGRAVLQARVSEGDLTHGVAADRARQPGTGVHPQAGPLLALQLGGASVRPTGRPRRSAPAGSPRAGVAICASVSRSVIANGDSLRHVQDLVGVGVADPGQHLLVGQHALDLPASADRSRSANGGARRRRARPGRAGPPRAPGSGR